MKRLVPVIKHTVVASSLAVRIRAGLAQFQRFVQNSLQVLLNCPRVACPTWDIVVEKNFAVQVMSGTAPYRSHAYLQFSRINLQDNGGGIGNQHTEGIPDGFTGWVLEGSI